MPVHAGVLLAFVLPILLGPVPPAVAAQLKRPVTLDDLEGVSSGKSVIGATLDVAADGRTLAVERGHRLWALDAKTGRVLQDLGEGLIPLWSPNGEHLAFYSNRSGTLQLWTWSVKTSQVRQLTELPGGVDPDPTTRIAEAATDAFLYDWSPDGFCIVFASRVARSAEQQAPEGAPLVLTNSTPPGMTLFGVFAQTGAGFGSIAQVKDGRSWGYRPVKKGELLFNQLFVVDLRKRDVMQLTDGERSFFHPAWSPDGRNVVASSVVLGVNGGDVNTALTASGRNVGAEILTIDMITHRQRVLAAGKGVKHRPKWSPDGSKIAWLASAGPPEYAQIHIARQGDGEELVGLQLDRKIVGYDWIGNSGEFVVEYIDRGSKLRRFRTGSHSVLALPGAHTSKSVWSHARGVWSQAHDGLLAWVEDWVEDHAGSNVWILSAGATQPVELFDLNPAAKELNLGRLGRIDWRTARGDETYGMLLYPPDYEPGKKYPVIVDAYPLGGGSSWMHPMEGNQSWASAGYVVFKPMPRAPHVWMACSRSPDFCRASKGSEAWDVMVDDVMSGIDEIVRRGIADPQRVCLYGHSNGGGVVSYLVTRTDRFRCAIVVAPAMADWVRRGILNTEGASSLVAFAGGVTIAEDLDRYIALSSVFRLSTVTTPMLIAAGDNDGDFLLDAIEVYNGARRAGAEVTFVRYPDQGHLFTGAAMRDFWERQMAFFRQHLRPNHGKGFSEH